MKILMLTDGLRSGGKERQLVEIIEHINDQFEIGVISYNTNEFYTDLVKEKVKYYAEIDKTKSKILPFFSTFNHIRLFKPDIIHTWDSLSSFYSYYSSMLFKIPFVEGSIRDAGIEKGWQRKLKLFFINRADTVLANSIAGLNAYGVKGKVIYNAINIHRFLNPVDNNQNNMIMVANFSDYKDQKTFLLAGIELINKKIIDKIYLLGDGKNRQKYIDWITEDFEDIRKKIIFTGSVPDVENYLSQCKFGVLCSTPYYSEGLSNSVLEYLGAGLIPIVTDIGGSSEIIEDRVNGFLIPAESPDEIVSIVEKLSKNNQLVEQIKINAKATIENKFNHNAVVNQLENLYQELVNV
ncbi:glycosyltransferase family 4 protein [Bacteroidota bacterium]